MEKYLLVIEKSDSGFSSFSPDIPGCITVGETIETTIENMKEAINLYLETLADDGKDMPSGKGMEYHIKNGLLSEGEIAEQYYLTQVDIQLPEMV